MSKHLFSRRAFLRGTGVTLALPMLEAMLPPLFSAPERTTAPRRMICINTTLSILPEHLFPAKPGRHYALTPYLQLLKDYRQDFTLVSGTSHPEVDGNHSSDRCFLTAAPHPWSTSFRNSISLDQLAVEKLKPDTRFSSLALSTTGAGMSYARGGAAMPTDQRPSDLFKKLFINGTDREVAAQVEQLKEGHSIMDNLRDEAKRLEKTLGPGDRDRLNEYFNSVREVEQNLARAQEWARKPKPVLKDVKRHTQMIEPVLDLFKPDDVVTPALFLVQRWINEHLKNTVSPRLLYHLDQGRQVLRFMPQNLLGAVWLQFAQAIDANKEYRACKECGSWFEISLHGDGRTKRRLFCSEPCKSKDYRERREHARQWRGAGKSVKQIAAGLGTDIETIKRWLAKKPR